MLCADISTELDLAVSGSKDGTCILHSVRHGRYLNTLKPRKGNRCEIHHASLSGNGILVIYTEDTTMRHRVGVYIAAVNLITNMARIVSILVNWLFLVKVVINVLRIVKSCKTL